MNIAVGKLVHEALDLPVETRALLAEKLLESLDYEENFKISKKWRAEIIQRCRDLDQGRVKLISANRVLAGLRKQIR
ncbi:MAG: addiction module protein [bacterium]